MIVRRIAMFFALLCGGAMTQLPEYAQQYQQRLGGAITELARVVADFDRDAQTQGWNEKQGIDHLLASPDEFVRQGGTRMIENSARLVRLEDLQQKLQTSGPAERLITIVTHFDAGIGALAIANFQPAVPVTLEALVLGLIGFAGGGGTIHAAHYSFKRRLDRRARTLPARALERTAAGTTSPVLDRCRHGDARNR